MSWIRVNCVDGRQFTAPSFAPPPALLGLDRLTTSADNSIRLLFARPASYDGAHVHHADVPALHLEPHRVECAEGGCLTVLVEAHDAGAPLGHVTIAVAASDVEVPGLWETTTRLPTVNGAVAIPCVLKQLLSRVKGALLCSDDGGIQSILDSLCSHVVVAGSVHEGDDADSLLQCGDDRSGNAVYRAELGLATVPSARAVTSPATMALKPHVPREPVSTASVESWMRRRAFLYFVDANVIPLSPLFTSVWYRSSDSDPAPDATQATSKPATPTTNKERRHIVPKTPSARPPAAPGFACIPSFAAALDSISDDAEIARSELTTLNGLMNVDAKTAAQLMKHNNTWWSALAKEMRAAVTALLDTLSGVIESLVLCASVSPEWLRTAWWAAWSPTHVRATPPLTLPFVAVCSPSGLVATSATFLRDLSLEDRLRLTTLAIAELVSPLAADDACRTVHLPYCARTPDDEERIGKGAEPDVSSSRPWEHNQVGFYDVTLLVIGRAVAAVVGFARPDARTPSPLSAPLAAWVRTQNNQQCLATSQQDVTSSLPTACSDAVTDLAIELCRRGTSRWSPATEHVLQQFEAAVAAGAIGGAPRFSLDDYVPLAVSMSEPAEPHRRKDGTSEARIDLLSSSNAPGSTVPTASVITTQDQSTRQEKTAPAKARFCCLGTLCARKKRTNPQPDIKLERTPSAESTRARPPVSQGTASAARAAPASHAHSDSQQHLPSTGTPPATALFRSLLAAAARVTMTERHLEAAVEADPSDASRQRRGQTAFAWSDGVHAAFWLARPMSSAAPAAALSSTETTSTWLTRPGYGVGFFRRALQSSTHTSRDDQIEDPTRTLPTVVRPVLDGSIAAAASHLAIASCVVRARASLVCSVAERRRTHVRRHRAGRSSEDTTPNTGLTVQHASASDDSDDDDSDDGGDTRAFAGGCANADESEDASLLTCLCVPYVLTGDEGSRAKPRVSLTYHIQCAINLYGVHLGVESDLMEALARQKPVNKAVKESCISADEATRVVQCTTLLHTLQGVAHSVVEHAHRLSI